jgi:hypothetical protein
MKCCVCGGGAKPRTIARQQLGVCESCGFALVLDSGVSEYWNDEAEESAPIKDYWTAAKDSYFRGALDKLATVTPGRRLLDFGGGSGYFSKVALDASWDAYSYDLSERGTRIAARLIGDRAISSVPQGLTFDVITLWCVIAHTTDPGSLVEAVRGLAHPGTVVFLTTPNFRFQRPYAYVRGRLGRPIVWSDDDHLGQFTRRSLTALLTRHGFDAPRFHYFGITETCVATGDTTGALVAAKRVWNRTASVMYPGLVSELQATAIAV